MSTVSTFSWRWYKQGIHCFFWFLMVTAEVLKLDEKKLVALALIKTFISSPSIVVAIYHPTQKCWSIK